jgi:hypothetical protein
MICWYSQLPSSYHGNKSYRNTSDKIETGNGFDCSNSLLRVCFLSRNYNLVPYDKSPASPSPVQYNCARLVCRQRGHPKMASIRSVFKVCYSLWGSNYNGNMNFFATPSINLLNTAMIDCPVASIGSTSNKYLLLKSAIAWYSHWFQSDHRYWDGILMQI